MREVGNDRQSNLKCAWGLGQRPKCIAVGARCCRLLAKHRLEHTNRVVLQGLKDALF
jgi:hypothetical protein